MNTLYSIMEVLSYNGLHVLGLIALAGVLFLGGKVLYLSARRILRDMGDK